MTDPSRAAAIAYICEGNRRWLALISLCLGVMMIVLNSTIVNVALPSIRADLGFSETSLVWVVNTYMLVFGGFILLAGRLGDLYGGRRLFLFGIVLFTGASLLCGISTSRAALIGARALQGLGGAAVSATALSLIVNMFPEQREHTKAMGVYGFVTSGGGSIGILLGGLLTSKLSWHWIFLVNLPIGAMVYSLSNHLLPVTIRQQAKERLDIAGAVTVTMALMLVAYALGEGNNAGWASKELLGVISAAAALFVAFFTIESRVSAPLVPLALFRSRPVAVSNIIGALWAAIMYAWFFIAALYMQRVLHYDSLHVGFGFLPANLVMGILSLGLSAKLVIRFGTKVPLVAGLLIAALGFTLLARASSDAGLLDLYPAIALIGTAAGLVLNPLLVVCMSGVAPTYSGLASGLANTAFRMGGAIGLAAFASAAAAYSKSLSSQGVAETAALNEGYRLAFVIGAVMSVGSAVIGATLLPRGKGSLAPPSHRP